MIDLPSLFYIHVWPEAPSFITVSAFSRRNLFVTFGIPLLSPLSLLAGRDSNTQRGHPCPNLGVATGKMTGLL